MSQRGAYIHVNPSYAPEIAYSSITVNIDTVTTV